ncbi:hypothetical protein EU546_00485 [Candidatus Thorarchaeota archaeon]|nr:MAG: hypothetical protein EU546_00485 [Candidatus Thorarchaeota archaeon]
MSIGSISRSHRAASPKIPPSRQGLIEDSRSRARAPTIRRMIDLNRKRIIATVLAAMLLSPFWAIAIPVQGRTNPATNAKIGPMLEKEMSMTASDDSVPIVAKFPEHTTSLEMFSIVTGIVGKGLTIRHSFSLIPVISAYATPDAVDRLAAITQVEAIDIDRTLNLESRPESHELSMSNGVTYVHPDKTMDVDKLWSQGYNGTDITVAVLDSGAQSDHPDLVGKLTGFQDLINEQHDMNPADGVDAYDDNGHGTACAWLVSGSGDGMGGAYTGMAPGAGLLIVKVLDDTGAGQDSTIAEGIEFAVEEGVDVISLSLGGTWTDSSYVDPSAMAAQAAVEDGRISVFVAAGNSGPATQTINSPAVVEEVVTVGSSSGSSGVVSFSSKGPVERTVTNPPGIFTKPDVLAPGSGVVSGRWEDANAFEYPLYNFSQFGYLYTQWSGTSVSAPLAAGVCALLMEQYSGLSPLEIKSYLMKGATDLGQDAMAQGFGIVNASESSELISETSRIMTIAAPLRYPTLPGGSGVLIVGDERNAQNVTVISTVSLGQTDIEIEGNASEFIVTEDSVTVSVGYSYFSVGLEVPEDIPLNATGRYTGCLDLVSDNTSVCSIELDFTVSTYGGRLLVDMAHHSLDDQDDPTYYRYFEDYLRGKGVITALFSNPTQAAAIQYGDLSQSDVFMIMDTETFYTDNEVDAIHQFIQDGGTLLILSEFYDNTTRTASFAIESYNRILEPVGIQCEERGIGVGIDPNTGQFYREEYGAVVENDSLTVGVSDLYVLSGSTLSVDPSVAGAQGLFWIDPEKTHAIVAKADYGDGKVIAISDGSILYDSSVYDAVSGGADNLNLLRNIAENVVPARPRIFDVELSRGEIGEQANVTTYIFDEDLDSVSITITTPNGESLTSNMNESLGYKFTSSFLMETGGFYDMSIRAVDLEGNVKLFRKTFLVTVETVAPDLSTIVMVSLIAVVAVGLVYVAYLKYGRKRGSRRPSEGEWEIKVEDRGRPPEIE